MSTADTMDHDPIYPSVWLAATPENRDLVSVLSFRDFEILRRHYGLAGFPSQTFGMIARRFGLSRQRIHQRAHEALLKLKTRHASLYPSPQQTARDTAQWLAHPADYAPPTHLSHRNAVAKPSAIISQPSR